MAAPISFTLKDRDDNPHQYIVTMHNVADGLEVIDAMTALGIGGIIEAMFGAMGMDKDGAVTMDNLKALRSLDSSTVARGLREGIQASGGLRKLAPLILKNTNRDGQRLNAAGLELAYPGNYGELSAALKQVVDANHFFDVLAGFFADAS